MVTWKEFATVRPDLAEIGRRLLYQYSVGYWVNLIIGLALVAFIGVMILLVGQNNCSTSCAPDSRTPPGVMRTNSAFCCNSAMHVAPA